MGVLINTPNGRIVETGDFKFDLTPIGQMNSDYQKMAYIGQIGVTLLLSDSTNSSVSGFSISEKKVAQSIQEEAKKHDFISIEDFQKRCHVSTTLVDKMRAMNLFGDLPESSQLSLF